MRHYNLLHSFLMNRKKNNHKISLLLKKVVEENINQELRLKDRDEARADLIEEINWNALISKEHKKS